MIKAKYIYAACFCLMAANVCAGNKTCAQKKAEIESLIAIAENYGRTMKVHGLKKALSKLEKNCTDEELLQKHQNKIKDKENDVRKAEAELAEAKASGKEHKIVKKQNKLAEQKRELEKAVSGN